MAASDSHNSYLKTGHVAHLVGLSPTVKPIALDYVSMEIYAPTS